MNVFTKVNMSTKNPEQISLHKGTGKLIVQKYWACKQVKNTLNVSASPWLW